MLIGVIGGGIFGVTAAVELARHGHSVELFEMERDILQAASGINQYRLHRGYHYPRSHSTAQSSKSSEASFRRLFGDAVLDNVSHFYGVSRRDSRTSAEDFVRFCDDMGLEYKVAWPEVVRRDSLQICVKVREGLFDPVALRRLCWRYLRQYGVRVHLKTKVHVDALASFDFRVIATYARLNETLGAAAHPLPVYQFEVCEKPVVRLSPPWRHHSVVIMDGPFMCVDPLGTTGLSVMGNVVHAIHHTNVGTSPEIPSDIRPLLNQAITACPSLTKIERFIDSADEFLAGMSDAEHVGSMFTVRAVLPHIDETDGRPTIVSQVNANTLALFSGKIGTCVEAAREVVRQVTVFDPSGEPLHPPQQHEGFSGEHADLCPAVTEEEVHRLE